MGDATQHVRVLTQQVEQQLRQHIRAQKKRSLMFLFGLLTFTEFLESQMFIFASSHIIGGIDAGPREFAYVQTAYAVGVMLMIILQQWLSRRLGYRHYLVLSLALFMLGALGCAWSNGLWSLTLARFIQGIGGGAFFTSSRILVNLMFPLAERARALKYFMLLLMASSAVAPVLAAHLIEYGAWQWVFYGALPFALWALGLVLWLLPPNVGRRVQIAPLSKLPLLTFALAVLLLQWMLTITRFDFFTHPSRLWGGLVLGFSLLLLFLWQQSRHPEPLIHIRELNHPVYLVGLGLYFLYYFIASFGNYVFPIYTEQGLHLSLLTVGWMSSLAGLSGVLVCYVYLRWLTRRFVYKKPLMVCGALGLALSAAWFSQVGPQAGWSVLWVGLMAKGMFGVLLVLPVAGLTFAQLQGEDRFAHGYQGKNLMRQIATSSSTAIAAVMMTSRIDTVDAELRSQLQSHDTGTLLWLEQTQQVLMGRGLDALAAEHTTWALLASRVHQQAQLIAAEQLYEVLAVLALLTALIVWVQRKLL